MISQSKSTRSAGEITGLSKLLDQEKYFVQSQGSEIGATAFEGVRDLDYFFSALGLAHHLGRHTGDQVSHPFGRIIFESVYEFHEKLSEIIALQARAFDGTFHVKQGQFGNIGFHTSNHGEVIELGNRFSPPPFHMDKSEVSVHINCTMASETKGFGFSNLIGNRYGETAGVAPAGSDTYSAIGTGRPVITEDVEIKGELAFSGELEFNGRFEGTLDSDGSLIVGEKAVIKGDIGAETAIVAGKVQGDIKTLNKVHLRPDAMVYGDIQAGTVVVDEGAVVEGKITTTTNERGAPDFNNIFSRLVGGKPSAKPAKQPPSTSVAVSDEDE